ncbi:Cullin, partial [Infundibulicybe gibba]
VQHGEEFSSEKTWLQLAKNIREIQNHNASNLSFEENHRFGYNMVLYKAGKMLYDGLLKLVSENLDKLANANIIPAFPAGGTGDPMQRSQEEEMLLKALKYVWDDHTDSMIKLGQILKYMDRVYCKSAEVPETWDAGLSLFLDRIIRPPIQDHLITAILNQIQFERDGYGIHRSAVKGCVGVFLKLEIETGGMTVYKRDLEPPLLRDSEAFFKAEAQKLLDSCDAPEFLRRATRFESEDSRTHYYLSRQTAPLLRQILQEHLLTPHLSDVMEFPNSGLDVMIDLDKTEDLSRLYRLSAMVPIGLPCLNRSMKASISRRGKEINRLSQGVDGELDPATTNDTSSKGKAKARAINGATQTLTFALKWVQDVLDLKDKFDYAWINCFKKDRELESGINEAFESFINRNEKSSEYISLFIDDHLKRGLKGKTDTEVDTVLDKTITVFRYITEKDVFERYYKNHLAKRLLLGRSVSDDAERGMLAKLKVECGFQFTQKLEGMFHDMKISEDTMKAYRSSKSTAHDIDLSVIVMTSTFWPMSHSSSPCNLPEVLLKTCKSFEHFYLSRHSGRRLTWQPSLGNADVRVSFKTRQHDLNVSTFALVILLLFESLSDSEFLTYSEIKNATAIVDGELQRHLQSLACAKFKILKKHPPGRDVNPEDSFSFNDDFTSTLQKIKINTISSRVETGEERKETRDRIDEERRHQTEACIVRIMKDRKHMSHNDLVNEVTRQLASRFQPEPLNIKKRIEDLIGRDYLERCDDRKSYNYLVS